MPVRQTQCWLFKEAINDFPTFFGGICDKNNYNMDPLSTSNTKKI